MRRIQKKSGFSSKDLYIVILFAAWMILYAFRIPLQHLIGDLGMAYFSVAGESYFFIAGVIAYGLSEAVAMLVKYRIKREQYRSAQKVLSSALLLGAILGLLFSSLFALLGPYLADIIWKFPLAGLAMQAMSPAIFFYVLAGVFRGYFQGSGSRIPSMQSHILHGVVTLAGGLAGASLLGRYGVKVSALLRSPHYANAYGAMGASLGFLAASVICFLHTWVIYLIYRRVLRQQGNREPARGQDVGIRIFSMIAGNGATYLWLGFVFGAATLIGQILLFQNFGTDEGLKEQWGVYYGRCGALTGIISMIGCMVCVFPVRRLVIMLEREEYRNARERFGILIHQCVLLAVPTAIWMAVFSENLLNLFYQGDNKAAAVWMQWSSVIVLLSVFAAVFMHSLLLEKKARYVALIGTGGFALYLVSLIVMLNGTKLRVEAVILAEILFLAVVAAAGFWQVARSFQYKQEWIRSVAVTIVAAAISGIVAMLLNKLFSPFAGSGIALLIGLAAALLCYLAILLITRAIRQEELEWLPGGGLLRILAEWLHIY